ncbi:hypothetical protein JFU47_12165 [Pseudomonas sp. TH39(2020)]|uniref:DUF6387 family protein n=1 Tax=Pseudomonas sp. TH39(2020) TaxID=2796349 RepID=UPI0019115C4F|nr:DUF6387 family protein [Pseudomonas sp. TH39(2020)]MBK5397452.1 hypothetical protein [Pseudomonas sp. TH39(2020)]
MAKIHKIGDLAAWFNPDHYLSAKTLSAAEMYRQLHQKESMLFVLKTSKDKNHVQAEAYAKRFSVMIKYVRGVDVKHALIPDFYGWAGYERYLANEKRGVAFMTMRDLYNHAINTPGYEHQPEKLFVDSFKLLSENLPMSMYDDPPLLISGWKENSHERYVPLLLDKIVPDVQLKAGFAVKLPEIRAATKHDQKEIQFYSPSLESLARYGVLQYLDLWIWQLETGIKIPRGLMILAIGQNCTNDRLRTTIKWAKKLMDNGLGDLLAQAATESTANTPKSGKLNVD